MVWSKIMKELRHKLLLSQTEMAALLNVSFASINRYENGHHEPTIKVKRKVKSLCEENDINIENFIREVKNEQ